MIRLHDVRAIGAVKFPMVGEMVRGDIVGPPLRQTD